MENDVIDSKKLEEMLKIIVPIPYKNLWEGSRTILTPEGAYTEIRHDNKVVCLCRPDIFLRLYNLGLKNDD